MTIRNTEFVLLVHRSVHGVIRETRAGNLQGFDVAVIVAVGVAAAGRRSHRTADDCIVFGNLVKQAVSTVGVVAFAVPSMRCFGRQPRSCFAGGCARFSLLKRGGSRRSQQKGRRQESRRLRLFPSLLLNRAPDCAAAGVWGVSIHVRCRRPNGARKRQRLLL